MNYKTSITGKLYLQRLYIFTLLELLIVISIIMILISLLVPALRQTQGKARELKCNGNLKQIGLAYNTYVNDYAEWLTAYYTTGCTPGLLLPYIAPAFSSTSTYYDKYKENTVYHCPSATDADSSNGSLYSYGHNEHMNSSTTDSYWFIQKSSRVIRPSQVFVFTDAAFPTLYNDSSKFSFRHRKGINIVYFDNHCAWISEVKVINTIPGNYPFWYGRNSL